MPPTTVAITGGSGFIGSHLVEWLSRRERFQIRLLVHADSCREVPCADRVTLVRGDLLDRSSLTRLTGPAQVVVNLAFLASGSHADNLRAAENLASACAESDATRLIHCSTAVVVGAAAADIVDETTVCRPATAYEVTKLAVENVFRRFAGADLDVVVLRPTAVFGPGGRNLLKLADAVHKGSRLASYLKRSVHGRRRMNAVGVDNVVGAIGYLIDSAADLNGEILIVSDDEYPTNNYYDIERFLRRRFDHPHESIPPLPVPRPLLHGLLRLSGRSCANGDRIYDGSKLVRAGYVKPLGFDESLATFAEWYRSSCTDRQSSSRAR